MVDQVDQVDKELVMAPSDGICQLIMSLNLH